MSEQLTLPRVLSYPPVHDYVDRLDGVAARLVHRDQPWPRLPDLYDPDWVAAHAGGWDIAHFHFTWEQYRHETLAAVLETHAAHGIPIVWTAHDLRNPHTSDVSHDAQYLDLLAKHADVVVTLTAGAAAAIEQRFGRHAEVIPHGPLVPPDEAARQRQRWNRPRGEVLRLFLLAKSLRANVDWQTPMEVVPALADEGIGVELTVYLHEDAPDRDTVTRMADASGIKLETGPRLPEQQLWERIGSSDALLLPYRWGTHSGLMELATDLGTEPVAGHVGFLNEQAPAHLVRVAEHKLDPDHLALVLRELAHGRRRLDPVPIELRRRTLAEFRSAHTGLYARLSSSAGTAVER